MAERFRFHLDEPVDPDVARALRKHGIDVTATQEAGLRTKSDADQLGDAHFSQRPQRSRTIHNAAPSGVVISPTARKPAFS